MATRDSRGFGKPNVVGKPANKEVDMNIPGSGLPAPDYGADQLDNRSAAHFAEGFPGKKIDALKERRRQPE